MNIQPLIDQLKSGWLISKRTYTLVTSHKKTLLFMMVPSILYAISFIFFIISCIPFDTLIELLPPTTVLYLPTLMTIRLITFALLIVSSITGEFSKVALSCYIFQILNNEQISVKKSLKTASLRFWTTLQWACINTTIGIIVRMFGNKEGNSRADTLVAKLLSSTILLSWNLLTFFTPTIIAAQNISVLDAIKESGIFIKKTWGKAMTAEVSFGTIALCLFLPYYALLIGLYYLIIDQANPPIALLALDDRLFYGIVGLCAFFIPLAIVIYMVRTMTIIFKTALYNYANNKPTGPFGKELLQSTFLPSNQ